MPTRKTPRGFSKNAYAFFSCLDSDESGHCATHLPVRESAYSLLPSEGTRESTVTSVRVDWRRR